MRRRVSARMFTQLNPPIPLTVLDKGKGYAVGVIDYGQEHNLIWVTALSDSGEIWCAPNPQVRFQQNWTMGRRLGGKNDGCAEQPPLHAVG